MRSIPHQQQFDLIALNNMIPHSEQHIKIMNIRTGFCVWFPPVINIDERIQILICSFIDVFSYIYAFSIFIFLDQALQCRGAHILLPRIFSLFINQPVFNVNNMILLQPYDCIPKVCWIKINHKGFNRVVVCRHPCIYRLSTISIFSIHQCHHISPVSGCFKIYLYPFIFIFNSFCHEQQIIFLICIRCFSIETTLSHFL